MVRLLNLDLFVLLVPHPLNQICLTSAPFAPFHACLYPDRVAPVALVTPSLSAQSHLALTFPNERHSH